MARRFVELVFDDFVVGRTAVFTPSRFDLLLGSVSRFALHLVADRVSGTGPGVSVQAQHSTDGRILSPMLVGGGSEIPTTPLSTTSTTSITGYVDYPAGALRRVRLQILLDGTNPVARIKLYATGRDRP
ncbi:MAG: hypothetical protein JNL21_40430 [Myxococcales bacterium]|nr:hypothetical protein [Myxococcales bacterium]